jgi:Coenzyme PQQ synthesis protein D (PqqD)
MRVPPHVVHRTFPGETVVLNLQTAQYHALNESAGMMFHALSTGERFAAAASRVAKRYGIPLALAERDLGQLCASLLERGLLAAAEPASV